MIKYWPLLGLMVLCACSKSSNDVYCGGDFVTENAGADPFFVNQWHLVNTGQSANTNAGLPGISGEDINVQPVWDSCGNNAGCRGEGIVVSVVDDGIDITHEDLQNNITLGSYNYLTGSCNPNPRPNESDLHGTMVAGLIAARNNNSVGVRGVAPQAKMLAFTLLQNKTTANEADAMVRGAAGIHVSNNSWGAPDYVGDLYAPELAWRTAIDTGLQMGRGGKGTIYIWAAGNGALTIEKGTSNIVKSDNSNHDGWANYRGVIAVGAVNAQGSNAIYSEKGANIVVSAPGGNYCDELTLSTTDLAGSLGLNDLTTPYDYTVGNYTKCMNGTSGATPQVSGVVALMLQANPNLGYRDVRSILAKSARKNDPTHPDWTLNGAGFEINHQYGFGVVDAFAAVEMSRTWTNLGNQITHAIPNTTVGSTIPDFNNTGVTSTVTVNNSGISNIELVEVTLNALHSDFGHLEITLTNTNTGTSSVLSEEHYCYPPCIPFSSWTFLSVRHLDEAADGNWTLTVKDLQNGKVGTFQSWSVNFYGS